MACQANHRPRGRRALIAVLLLAAAAGTAADAVNDPCKSGAPRRVAGWAAGQRWGCPTPLTTATAAAAGAAVTRHESRRYRHQAAAATPATAAVCDAKKLPPPTEPKANSVKALSLILDAANQVAG